jgi:uncharacterized membrane protein
MKLTNRTLLITLGILLLIMLVSPAIMASLIGFGVGSGMMNGGMMGGMMNGGMMSNPGTMPAMSGATAGWMMFLMTLRTVAVWAALIVAILLLVRLFTANRSTGDAFEILRRRYAAGEITQAEYERMRGEIEQLTPQPR